MCRGAFGWLDAGALFSRPPLVAARRGSPFPGLEMNGSEAGLVEVLTSPADGLTFDENVS